MKVIFAKIIDFGLCLLLGLAASLTCSLSFFPNIASSYTQLHQYNQSGFDRYFVSDQPYLSAAKEIKNVYLIVSGYTHYIGDDNKGLGANVYMVLDYATYDSLSLFGDIRPSFGEAYLSENIARDRQIPLGSKLHRSIGAGTLEVRHYLPYLKGILDNAKGVMVMGFDEKLYQEILNSGTARFLNFTGNVDSYGDITVFGKVYTKSYLNSLYPDSEKGKILAYSFSSFALLLGAFVIGVFFKRKVLRFISNEVVLYGKGREKGIALIFGYLFACYGLPMAILSLALALPSLTMLPQLWCSGMYLVLVALLSLCGAFAMNERRSQ